MNRRTAGLALLAFMILARLVWFESADLWIDEVATLHHVTTMDLATMQLYSVNSGYYVLLRWLSGGEAMLILRIGQLLSLGGLLLAWWAIGARASERGEDPWWPRAFLLVWPTLFVFSCVARSYGPGVGLFFFVLWLLETRRLSEPLRLGLLFVSLALGVYTLYMFALLYIPVILLTRYRFRANFYTALAVPIVFLPVTGYVLVQTVLHRPLIETTGASGHYWGAAYEALVFFNWPRTVALSLAALLFVLFVVARRKDRDLVLWAASAVALCGTMQLIDVNSFPRQGLPLLAFFIPAISVQAGRIRGGRALLFALICLILPYSLNRSVKTNGSREVAAIIETHGRPGDRIAVGSGYQGVPLDRMIGTRFPHMKTRYRRDTVPEFFGVPHDRVAYSVWDYEESSLSGERLWVLDRRPPVRFESWPVIESWPVDSGGNGARVLELRRKPE